VTLDKAFYIWLCSRIMDKEKNRLKFVIAGGAL